MTFPKCNKCGYSHPQPSAHLMAKTAITVTARTTTLPCVDETEDPITPPTTTEPDCPDIQADHPGERAGPDATDLIPGADPAAPLAGTPVILRAKALPLTAPADLPGGIEDLLPSGTIKTALR